MPKVVKHAWTHRPRSEGGTDPIEFPASGGSVTWATLTQFSKSLSPSGGYYTMQFDVLGTNDTGNFQPGAGTGQTPHLEINDPGYYNCLFGVTISQNWGAHDANIEPYVDVSGSPSQLDSNINTESDWDGSVFAQGVSFVSGTDTLYKSLWRHVTFHYEPGDGSDLGSLSPLLLGIRVLTTQTGAKDLTAQIHVERVCGEGFTVTTI